MKRSAINRYVEEAVAFFESHSFHLPPWAKWSPADWTRKGSECDEIRHNQLGWDVTDFSSGDFEKEGLTLVTLRGARGAGNPHAFPLEEDGGHHQPGRRRAVHETVEGHAGRTIV